VDKVDVVDLVDRVEAVNDVIFDPGRWVIEKLRNPRLLTDDAQPQT
jgi:hypothetical protein